MMGHGEVGEFPHQTKIAWQLLGLARKPSGGTGWAISLLHCMNRLKQSSGHVRPPGFWQ